MSVPRLTPDQITIAVTVYNRRQYVCQAVQSALDQTLPVRVMVVEDCGPDPGMEALLRQRFGSRLLYHRNPHRRGLFDNWNACIEQCPTRWLSILHDDDLLAPRFVEAMLELNRAVPEAAFYCGQVSFIDDQGRELAYATRVFEEPWQRMDLPSMAETNPVIFAGQLFRTECARNLGGFHPHSRFCGDWDMWFRLSFHHGGAVTRERTGFCRNHPDPGRGTNVVLRTGRKYALDFAQAKKNMALMHRLSPEARLDRRRALRAQPIPIRYLLGHSVDFSRRLLAYNLRLLTLSHPPHCTYAVFQQAARLVGPAGLRWASHVWRLRRRLAGRDTP